MVAVRRGCRMLKQLHRRGSDGIRRCLAGFWRRTGNEISGDGMSHAVQGSSGKQDPLLLVLSAPSVVSFRFEDSVAV